MIIMQILHLIQVQLGLIRYHDRQEINLKQFEIWCETRLSAGWPITGAVLRDLMTKSNLALEEVNLIGRTLLKWIYLISQSI